MDGTWQNIDPEFMPPSGSAEHPSVRYSACAVQHRGALVVTHGYFYNHQIHRPAWQSNAWKFTFRSRKWQQDEIDRLGFSFTLSVSPYLPQESRFAFVRRTDVYLDESVHRGESHGAPSARYSTSCVQFNGGLFIFGGDDGGHKHSLNNYVFQSWFDEMWRLDLNAFEWKRVVPRVPSIPSSVPKVPPFSPAGLSPKPTRSAAGAGGGGGGGGVGAAVLVPPKRALHTAVVVGESMLVYGGLNRGDTWRFSFRESSWTLLCPEDGGGAHPGKRHAHAAAAASDGFFIFGGTRHGPNLRPTVFDDLWFFSLASNAWKLITPSQADAPVPMPTPTAVPTHVPTPTPALTPSLTPVSTPSSTPSSIHPFTPTAPPARSHHSLVTVRASPPLLLLYGGALCTPGCKCYGDTWLFDAYTRAWIAVNASNAPIHRYRQNLLRDPVDGSFYLFGGESYRPYMYHNAIDRLVVRSSSRAGSPLGTNAGSVGATSSVGVRGPVHAPAISPHDWRALSGDGVAAPTEVEASVGEEYLFAVCALAALGCVAAALVRASRRRSKPKAELYACLNANSAC